MKPVKNQNELLGALVTMGADPFLIETDEIAREVFKILNASPLCSQLEEIEVNQENLQLLDLTEENM